MIVTAWNNGIKSETGSGYGLKVSIPDRDLHFQRAWKTVSITLPNGVETEVNIDKGSFWNGTCRELISKQIGKWLLESGNAPWPLGKPPRFELAPLGGRLFILDGKEIYH